MTVQPDASSDNRASVRSLSFKSPNFISPSGNWKAAFLRNGCDYSVALQLNLYLYIPLKSEQEQEIESWLTEGLN